MQHNHKATEEKTAISLTGWIHAATISATTTATTTAAVARRNCNNYSSQ